MHSEVQVKYRISDMYRVAINKVTILSLRVADPESDLTIKKKIRFGADYQKRPDPDPPYFKKSDPRA